MRVGELMQALEMMKTHVQRVTPDDSLRTALDKLDLYQTPALPLVDLENHPIGILTEGDVTRALLASPETGNRLRVGDVATNPVHCVLTEDTLESVVPLLLAKGYKRTPVVDKLGILVGALDRVDLLQWTLDKLEEPEILS